MTRIEIQNQALRILNRASDAAAQVDVEFSFTIAHRALQRLNNRWRACLWYQIHAIEGPSPTSNLATIPMPPDYRESATGYARTYTADGKALPVNNYVKTDVLSYRQRSQFDLRVSDDNKTTTQFDTRVFTENVDQFFVWPEFATSEITNFTAKTGNFWHTDYYRWLAPPVGNTSDWFTENCFDYLLYRLLVEAATMFGISPLQRDKWEHNANEAAMRAMNADVSGLNAGPLILRG